jgi:integrase
LREAESRLRKSKGHVGSNLTLLEYVAGPWKLSLNVKEGTRKDYEYKLNAFILPQCGHYRLRDLNHTRIKAWLAELDRTPPKVAGRRVDGVTSMEAASTGSLSPKYRTSIRDLFAAICKSAVLDGHLDRSPFDRIPRRKPKRLHDVVVLSEEMTKELVASLQPKYHALVFLGITTAMRPSELLGLTWDRLDFEQGTITVDLQLSRKNGEIFASELKTDNAYRTLDLSPELQDTLREHRRTFGLGPEGLLFTGRFGQIFRYKAAQEMFRRRFKTMPLPPRTGMHVLRHTAVSHHIYNGANPLEIQALCGHGSLKETLDTYGHLFPKTQETIGSSMDTVLGRFRGPRSIAQTS